MSTAEQRRKYYDRVKHESWYTEAYRRRNLQRYYANKEKHQQQYILKREIQRMRNILLPE